MLPARHLTRLARTPLCLARRHAQSVSGSTTKVPVPKNPEGEVYDPKSDMVQTIDIDDLPRAQKRFAKQFEKVNEERIKEIFQKNYKVSFYTLSCFSCLQFMTESRRSSQVDYPSNFFISKIDRGPLVDLGTEILRPGVAFWLRYDRLKIGF
uniref:Uncharacterized protein n=1 Tax=Panagrellus redivivus TaxID=6233 RepID=A0A7E4URM4_PANRE